MPKEPMELFEGKGLDLYCSLDELSAFTKDLVSVCERLQSRLRNNEAFITACNRLATELEVPNLNPDSRHTIEGVIARFQNYGWWLKQVKKIQSRKIEHIEILLGRVHKFSDIYVSDKTLRKRMQSKEKNKHYLDNHVLINDLGEEVPMNEMVEGSVSNPSIRRAELMCRIAGSERYAQHHSKVGTFFTFTCPSRMHARFASNGAANPRYDGTTPREANDYLNGVWQRIRAKLDRMEIAYFGLRVAEPQHDGTPHWHLLLFHDKRDFHELSNTIRHYNLQESGEEHGADIHRVDITPIDWEKGSAAGYIAKYISKNIDGAHLDKDLNTVDAAESAERIEAWASVWGIRQFQSIGTPPVTVWRELRKIKEELPQSILRTAQEAADEGDWFAFTQIMGQRHFNSDNVAVRLAKTWNDKPGKFGDPKGYEVFGVCDDSNVITTRLHKWTVKEKEVESE